MGPLPTFGTLLLLLWTTTVICTVISTLVVGFEHNKIGVFLMYESMDTCHCEALVNEVSPLLWTKARATSCFKAFPIYSFAVSF